MRTFTDPTGRTWDVAIERESWGTFVLMFAERGGVEVRRAVLEARSFGDAHAALARFNDHELNARLAEAEPWA